MGKDRILQYFPTKKGEGNFENSRSRVPVVWRKAAVILLFVLRVIQCDKSNDASLWARWWTYNGISGPKYWGLLNARWRLCTEGKRQSPIDIELKYLLFDPTLKTITITNGTVTGVVVNTGSDVTLNVIDDISDDVYIAMGPLSYDYRVFQIRLHFSVNSPFGSEHRVNNSSFPAELQIDAYNSDLYDNYSEAESSPHGLVTLAIFIQTSDQMHKPFNRISQELHQLRTRGTRRYIKKIHLLGLLPKTIFYITYEGSQSQPACHEVVTWIVMNKPLYISSHQFDMIRNVGQVSEGSSPIVMSSNNRPVQSLNGRSVRTNIKVGKECEQKSSIFYRVNRRYEQ